MEPELASNSYSGRYSFPIPETRGRKAARSRPVSEGPASIDPLTRVFWGLLIFSLPFTDVRFPAAAKSFGQPSSYLTIVLWVFVLLRILQGKESLRFLKSKALLFMFLFWVVAGISVSLSSQAPPSPWIDAWVWGKSIKQFAQLSIGLSIALFTAFFVRSWRDFRFAMASYFAGWIGSVFAQAIDFGAYFTRSDLLEAANDFIHSTRLWQFLGPFPRLRLSSNEASFASDYLLCLIPFFVLGAYYWKGRAWNIINSSVSVLVLFATMSFGGVAVFLGEAALMAMMLGRRAVGFLALAGGAPLLLALAISPVYAGFVWDRAVGVFDYGIETSDFSVRQRAAAAESAWATFEEHPWLGVGIGNASFYLVGELPRWATTQPDLMKVMLGPNPDADALGNEFLRVLTETGLVGTGLFVAMLATMVWGTFKAYRRAPERWKKSVYAAILVALLGQIAHYTSMSELSFRYWFFIWGLAICTVPLAGQADPRAQTPRVIYRKGPARTIPPTGFPTLPAP
jgi:O-antigen ligase